VSSRSSLGQAPDLTLKFKAKHALAYFFPTVSDEEKKFFNINTWATKGEGVVLLWSNDYNDISLPEPALQNFIFVIFDLPQ
jgi:hypothetical protein